MTGVDRDERPTRRGRTVVHARVLSRVAHEACATRLRVRREQLSVDVVEHAGGIALVVRSPVPIDDLADAAATTAQPTLFDRLSAVQEALRDEVTRVLGRSVTRVDIIVTGACVATRKRVT